MCVCVSNCNIDYFCLCDIGIVNADTAAAVVDVAVVAAVVACVSQLLAVL